MRGEGKRNCDMVGGNDWERGDKRCNTCPSVRISDPTMLTNRNSHNCYCVMQP